jgi:argininosuccinate lyase
VFGHVMGLLTLMKGQPLAYNKDNQEDKEPLFDTVDTVADTLRAFAEMLPGIEISPQAMRAAAEEGYSTATDLADYLVGKGLPFRDAHEAVARAVRAAAERRVALADLTLDELRSFAPAAQADVRAVLSVDSAVARRNCVGGTAPAQVRSQIERWRGLLAGR